MTCAIKGDESDVGTFGFANTFANTTFGGASTDGELYVPAPTPQSRPSQSALHLPLLARIATIAHVARRPRPSYGLHLQIAPQDGTDDEGVGRRRCRFDETLADCLPCWGGDALRTTATWIQIRLTPVRPAKPTRTARSTVPTTPRRRAYTGLLQHSPPAAPSRAADLHAVHHGVLGRCWSLADHLLTASWMFADGALQERWARRHRRLPRHASGRHPRPRTCECKMPTPIRCLCYRAQENLLCVCLVVLNGSRMPAAVRAPAVIRRPPWRV